jgi:prepilin-type processing-associated H-X9-DG protein
VREAANRMSCTNNMKQLGLGLHNFQSTVGFFPPSYINTATTNKATLANAQKLGVNVSNVSHSWSIFVLPYLEQDNVFKQYNLNLTFSNPANLLPRESKIKTFVCPTAPRSGDGFTTKTVGSAAIRLAPGDYAPNNGYSATLETLGLADITANRRGVMIANAVIQVGEITDGTSNTFLLSEDAGRPDRWDGSAIAGIGVQLDGGWADPSNEYITHGYSEDGKTSPGACRTNCTNNNEVYSFHSGGANHVFADGSVRFVSKSMNIRGFVKMITYAGNDITVD